VCEIVDDGERCDVWSEVQRRARKDHVCSCCRRTIKAGEQYTVHFSAYDGYHSQGGGVPHGHNRRYRL
jgi:hypothetical protein